jgi:tetratricopeptide (TPR) repeat protein
LLGSGAYYNARLRQEAAKARAAEAAAVAQRNLALNAFDHLVFDLQERLGNTPATRAARRSLLDTAIKGLESVALGNEGSAPDLSRAVAHRKLGAIYLQIGRTPEARRQLASARRLAENLNAQAPQDLAVAECLRDALAGLGAVAVHDHQYDQAKELLRRVVVLAERILEREPWCEGARQGLIEAHLELGRAYGFNGERSAAEGCYRRMHELAEHWVQAEPANLLARDLLATSYRKLADERKLVGDYPAARADYQSAIAIGRKALALDPDNFVFKRHLAVATDDLAGSAQHQGRIDEARALFEESERLFTEQVTADPEDFESQLRLMHVQSRAARLERDELQFARAAELFHRALELMVRLERAGRLAGSAQLKERQLRELREEITACELGPAALDDLDAVRSRRLREACLLLPIRVRALLGQRRNGEAIEAAKALCDLQMEAGEDFCAQARAICACLRHLDDPRWSASASPEWQALRPRCVDRAMNALTLAIERGFDEVTATASEDILASLRGHPGYQKLIDRLGRPPRPSDRFE